MTSRSIDKALQIVLHQIKIIVFLRNNADLIQEFEIGIRTIEDRHEVGLDFTAIIKAQLTREFFNSIPDLDPAFGRL